VFQQLWIPGPLPGLNEVIAAAKGFRGRGIGYSNMKSAWTTTVWALSKKARLVPVASARLTFTWFERSRRRDPDNFSSAGKKFILDGLVKAGVLPEDGWDEIVGFVDRWHLAPKAPGVMVTIES
jgi:hypothetical protein